MKTQYRFERSASRNGLAALEKNWIAHLTSPQDGMWESIRGNSNYWEIKNGADLIGYTCVDHEETLLQFYLTPKYLPQGAAVFNQYLEATGIKAGIVGTNNPTYLSLALNTVKAVETHTYLFREAYAVDQVAKEGSLKECQTEDVERIVEFCHYSVKAPVDWLRMYVGQLIEKGEIFVLEYNDEIIGTCEVRASTTAPTFADIGMIVSPDHRKKGYGTYLLSRAMQIAEERNRKPICSCEKDNVASFKSITNCGFVSMHQLLLVSFK